MPLAVSDARALVLPDGSALVGGGDRASGGLSDLQRYDPPSGVFSDLAEVYDSGRGASEPVGTMMHKRAGHMATRVPDGRVLISGGRGSAGVESTRELFDPMTGHFSIGPKMHNSCMLHVAQLLTDGIVLRAGGYQGCPTYIAAAQRFIFGRR